MNIDIKTEISKFKPHLGIESCETPPATWCTEPEFYKLDEKLLKQYWQFVCSVDQLEQPGAYVAGEFCDEQYLVTRTEKGELKAFYNVCRHHAAPLLNGSGCTREIVCPYHAWSYNLDGGLKKAPHMAGVKNFKRENLALKEIPLKVWNKFVLLNFSGGEALWDPELDLIDKMLTESGPSSDFSKLQFKGRRVYEIQCNWKVYIDNYLDGGYHVAHLHKGLAGQLEMSDYTVENYKTWTLQSCGGATTPMTSDTIDFKERIGDRALYFWLHPNFMINRYGPIMDTNWIVPIGHQKCLTIFDYYFMPEADEGFIAASIKASEQVQSEDVAICEAVQKGMRSAGYGAGRYAPTLESGEFIFHALVQKHYIEFIEKKLVTLRENA